MTRLDIALVVPPTLNLNTPYAALPRLTAWLRHLGHRVDQIDLSLELFLRVFSRRGLERLFAAVDPGDVVDDYMDVYLQRERYVRVVDDVVAFVQGRDPTLAHRIVRGGWLPAGPVRRQEPAALRRARFGSDSRVDLARHLATQMFQELAELFAQTISPHFGLSTYADKLAVSCPSFDPLAAELAASPTLFDDMLWEAADALIGPGVDAIGMTCPFPGNLIGALRIGQWSAAHRPRAARILGGGYPSTELRTLDDPRVFDFVDYVVLDDGEQPLKQICARLAGDDVALSRTFTRAGGRVVWHGPAPEPAARFRDLPAPDYDGLDMSRYVHFLQTYSPIARLGLEGAWLKLTAAHGCYWKKCTFCDVHLPYIDDFDPLPASQLADQMDAMHAQTGLSSFHFTDEAAPPPLLVNLALELLRRDRSYQFWGNIRYDPGFTPDRCRLLAAAGMIAVTGGIEIASDAVLPQMAKGITVPQVVHVLRAFAEAGVVTHAYLIYGFPGETVQDTVDSLELVRQLRVAGWLQSGFYHRFGATAHSPIGRAPGRFGLRVVGPGFAGFAHNTLVTEHHTTPPHEWAYRAVRDAILHLSAGEHLDRDVRAWFDREVPAPTVGPDHVAALAATSPITAPRQERLCWLGGVPQWRRGLLSVSGERGELHAAVATEELARDLARCHPSGWDRGAPPRTREFTPRDWYEPLRAQGMVVV